MKITSSVFEHNGQIPARYTCEGENINPPLEITDVPVATVSLALVVSDPDSVGKKPFYHWIAFNIDPNTGMIAEDEKPSRSLEGRNDGGRIGYIGPCPPSGTGAHRYVFSLYALDRMLDLDGGAAAEDVLRGTEGHVLVAAELIGTYSK